METQRIEYLDIAKGVGILLVVIGHCINSNSLIGKWIWTFHMPLFFIISGMLYDSSRYPYFSSFFRKKTKTLLLPLLIFSILIITLKSFIFPESFNINSLRKTLPDVAYWFIFILYLSEIIYYFINKFINNTQTKSLVILSLPIISFILMKQCINLPYNISSVFICTFFYGIGNLFRYTINVKIEKSKNNYRNMFLSLILLFIPAISVYFTDKTIDLRTNTIPYPIIYNILIAFTGVYGTFLFSKMYFKNNSFIKM